MDEQKARAEALKPFVPLMRGTEVVEYPADQDTLTKRYTEEAVKFIRANPAKPFFIYLPHTMVHVPLAPRPRHFAARARVGCSAMRWRSSTGPWAGSWRR